MTDHDDPGWAQPLREFGLFSIPLWGPLVQLKRRRNEANELIRLRSVFLSLNVALFLFIVAFAFIAPFDGGDEGRVPWVVVIIGILSAVWVDRIRRWPLGDHHEGNAQSRSHIERKQREIAAAGSSLSLLDAIVETPPPSRQ